MDDIQLTCNKKYALLNLMLSIEWRKRVSHFRRKKEQDQRERNSLSV